MSEFLYHSSCPSCGSRDNLGVWEDHSYCFGCGYLEKNGKSLNLESMKTNNKNNKESNEPTLPSDYSIDIPSEPREWLDNYGITDGEVYTYKLGWSDGMQRLIFPVYDQDKLVFWQGRQFGKYKGPKHITDGKSSEIFYILLGPQDKHSAADRWGDDRRIICCEDPISAIKIARVENSWCLFGSNIPTTALNRVSRTFSRLGVWLDRDKAEYALKTCFRASVFFKEASPIITDLDPKKYNNEEIKEWLKLPSS